jgi:hypothetical protein
VGAAATEIGPRDRPLARSNRFPAADPEGCQTCEGNRDADWLRRPPLGRGRRHAVQSLADWAVENLEKVRGSATRGAGAWSVPTGLRRGVTRATLWGPTPGLGTVEIGEPERTYTVEPLEDPVPRERPGEPAEQPAGPTPAEEPVEPERVPAP